MMLTGRLRAVGVLVRGLMAPKATVSRLPLVVRLTDVDLNVHLTNSRYPQLMDLGRLDLLVRSGVAGALAKQRQRPILVETHLRFLRDLPLGTSFVLETTLVGVERRAAVFRQRFLVREREHAVATAKVVVLAGGRVVQPDLLKVLLPDQVQGSEARTDQ